MSTLEEWRQTFTNGALAGFPGHGERARAVLGDSAADEGTDAQAPAHVVRAVEAELPNQLSTDGTWGSIVDTLRNFYRIS